MSLIFARFQDTLTGYTQPKTPSFHHPDSQLEQCFRFEASLFPLNEGNVPVAKKFTASSRLTMVLIAKILHPCSIAYSQKIDEIDFHILKKMCLSLSATCEAFIS